MASSATPRRILRQHNIVGNPHCRLIGPRTAPGTVPPPHQKSKHCPDDDRQMRQRTGDAFPARVGIADLVEEQEGDERRQHPGQPARRNRADRRGQHRHTHGGGEGRGLVDDMSGRGRIGNPQLRAQTLRDRECHLDDTDNAERAPRPPLRQTPHLWGASRRGRPDRSKLRTPGQATQHLGLLDRISLPPPARLTVREMLIDPYGGDGLTLPVDSSRQRLPSDVAIHTSIVAHHGTIVPATMNPHYALPAWRRITAEEGQGQR